MQSTRDDIQHSILVVSGSEQFAEAIRALLPKKTAHTVEIKKSAAAARSCVLERFYDIIAINAPLPDEKGLDFVLDITEQLNASVLFAASQELCSEAASQLAQRGILPMPKPVTRGQMERGLRFLIAIQDRVSGLERELLKAKEKTEELKLVDKAKFMLVEKKGMTEEEAHRYLGKQAMDNGLSKKRIAERILEDEYGF